MAQFEFQVGRKNEESATCIAQVPGIDEMLKFPGGEIVVKTPKGDRKVKLPSAKDLIVDMMTIELQNGVRDFLFPKDESGKNGKIRKRSKYV